MFAHKFLLGGMLQSVGATAFYQWVEATVYADPAVW